MQQTGTKTRQNWMGKVDHWQLYKRLKFSHTAKWYMHKPEFVRENETQNIRCDFVIQTDQQT